MWDALVSLFSPRTFDLGTSLVYHAFAWPALVGPLIGAAASALFSKHGSKTPSALTRSASAEAAVLEQQKRYRDLLFQSIQTLSGNPRPDYFHIGKDNPEDLYNSLAPTAGLNSLFQLAGLGTFGTGATQQLASLGQRQNEISQQAQGQLAQDFAGIITDAILSHSSTANASAEAGAAAAQLGGYQQPLGTTQYGDTGL